MGKRKERRLAALSNAGRRVKLDLFAEPSGDLGGATVHDEVGGEPKDSAGLPNSPSSSGQEPQNPLLLLGQYSDEDLDEESDKRLTHVTVESSSADHDDQVEGPPGEGCKDMGDNAREVLATQKAEELHMEGASTPQDVYQKLEDGNTRGSDATDSGDLHKEVDSAVQTSVAGISEFQVVGDVSSGWKIVMHEESNQCYYWNTETGETSWEVPDSLAGTAESTSDQKTPVTENMVSVPLGTHESDSVLGVELDNYSAAQIIGSVYDNGPQMAGWVEGHRSEALNDKSWDTNVNSGEFQSNLDAINALPSHGDLACPENSSNDAVASIERKTGIDLSTRLVRQCECLLERLTSLKGSEGDFQGHGQMSKYILEVEIRLADIKALISYGSSLVPFWVHSERQLKRLEGVINDEIYQLAKSAVMDEVEATHIPSSAEKDKLHESMGNESEADGNRNNVVFSAEIPHVCTVEAHYGNAGSQTRHLGSGAVVSELHVSAFPNETIPNPGFHAGEDVDMDVDMEVDDAIPAGSTDVRNISSDTNFALQSNLPPEKPSFLVLNDVSTVPPPPDDEWIPPPPPDNEQVPPPPPDNEQVPPPPPDNEQVPPPPPDELAEASFPPPPSYTEMGQPVPYMEQYNLTYPDPNFQYYGHVVAEVPSSSFFGHADGSQVAVPHASLYYETVPNTYTETAPVIVNAVEPVAYYDLKEGTVPHVPVDSNIEPPQFHSESGFVSYNATALEPVDAVAVAGSNPKVNVSTVGGDTEIVSAGVPSASATIQAPATFSVKESVSAQITNGVTAAVAVSSAKVRPKVARAKKRTVAVASSLRSNKKVSSLVDKWKAAKEELKENEEDEPENAYKILERKRQREIEEWHAKQIASGEAKDNANFQPLGGDWRDRVKRRRAQAAREAAKIVPEAHNDENQQPDLADLSSGLPSGWQAYWDESSKQVYYGNAITSETTWTRPTK